MDETMGPTLALSLTGLETVFLVDSLRNGATVKDVEDELASTKPLIVKLAGLYRELVSTDGIKPGPLLLAVTEPEVWLLRAKVRSGDVAIDGTTNVGVPLSLKLYELLGRFKSGLADIETVDEDEPLLSEATREALKKLKEATDG